MNKGRVKTITIRTLRTMAQTAAGLVGAVGLLQELDWGMVVTSTILAGIVCVLMHLGDSECQK